MNLKSEPQSNISNAQSNRSIPRLVVKFRDDLAPEHKGGFEYADHVEDQFNQTDRGIWEQLTSPFNGKEKGITLNRLFTAIPPDALKKKREQARLTDPTYLGPDPLTYFSLEYPAGADLYNLVKSISSWPIVETAYVESQAVVLPEAFSPTNEPNYREQGYLSGNGIGINVQAAWDALGGINARPGDRVKFIDIEQGWHLEHQDLLVGKAGSTIIQEVVGINHPYDGWRSHGTSVLGIVLAQDNEYGNIGIAPNAIASVVSERLELDEEYDSVVDRPNAILHALDRLGFGDVLLLEAQHVDGCYSRETTRPWPAEVEDAVFAAIRLGSALGIVIIEPAGNGGRDFDIEHGEYLQQISDRPSGVCWRSPDLRTVSLNPEAESYYRDSGAIMVAGGTADKTHSRWERSNFGKRINCYGWAEKIHALTTREIDEVYQSEFTEEHTGHSHSHYFNGTSGAAAIIAGAALLAQHAAKQLREGDPLSPYQLRALFSNISYGTGSAAERIGVMPDLGEIVTRLRNIPKLQLRDATDETGLLSASPDVILRNGRLSAFERPAFLRGEPVRSENLRIGMGIQNYVHVRVKNDGSGTAFNVNVYLFYAKDSDLATPSSWREVGLLVLPKDVNAGSWAEFEVEVTAGVPPPAARYGNHHLLCLVSSDETPLIIDRRRTLESGLKFNWRGRDDFGRFVRDNPTVAWRSFRVG